MKSDEPLLQRRLEPQQQIQLFVEVVFAVVAVAEAAEVDCTWTLLRSWRPWKVCCPLDRDRRNCLSVEGLKRCQRNQSFALER